VAALARECSGYARLVPLLAYTGLPWGEAVAIRAQEVDFELRHTAASLAIATGADAKVVQTMLGHKTATMTLNLYGHLFPDQLDDLADRMVAPACAPDPRKGKLES
jgi:integrase